jgi:hypothetical protein
MPKLEIRIPMLAKGLATSQAKMEKKDSPMKPKDKDPAKPEGGSMALGGVSMWKPPSKKEMHENAVHDEVRHSMRKWVAGEISTAKHKETLKRAKKALGQASSYGLGVRQ